MGRLQSRVGSTLLWDPVLDCVRVEEVSWTVDMHLFFLWLAYGLISSLKLLPPWCTPQMGCSLDSWTKINPFFPELLCDFVTETGVDMEQILRFLCSRVLGSLRSCWGDRTRHWRKEKRVLKLFLHWGFWLASQCVQNAPEKGHNFSCSFSQTVSK